MVFGKPCVSAIGLTLILICEEMRIMYNLCDMDTIYFSVKDLKNIQPSYISHARNIVFKIWDITSVSALPLSTRRDVSDCPKCWCPSCSCCTVCRDFEEDSSAYKECTRIIHCNERLALGQLIPQYACTIS